MKPRDKCEHEVIHIWTKIHERASMEKRTGSTGKTYNMLGWSCVLCGLPFYPQVLHDHNYQSSRQPCDEEIHG